MGVGTPSCWVNVRKVVGAIEERVGGQKGNPLVDAQGDRRHHGHGTTATTEHLRTSVVVDVSSPKRKDGAVPKYGMLVLVSSLMRLIASLVGPKNSTTTLRASQAQWRMSRGKANFEHSMRFIERGRPFLSHGNRECY